MIIIDGVKVMIKVENTTGSNRQIYWWFGESLFPKLMRGSPYMGFGVIWKVVMWLIKEGDPIKLSTVLEPPPCGKHVIPFELGHLSVPL